MDNIIGNCDYAKTLEIGTTEYLFTGLFVISIIYSIPSIYITFKIVTKIQANNKRFPSVFYKLFLHDRLVTLLLFIIDITLVRVPQTGLVTSVICRIPHGYYLTALYVMCYYLLYTGLYSSIVISIVRVAAVLSPVEADKIQIRIALFLIPAMYLLPCVTTWFLVPVHAYFATISNSASLVMAYKKVYPAWRSSLALLFVTTITCLIVLLCFMVTMIRWRILLGRTTKTWNKSERSLLLLVCSLCGSIGLFCLLQFFFYYEIFYEISFLLRGFLQDMMVFIPTWVFYFTHPFFSKRVVVSSFTITVVPASKSSNK
ncbi:unnamed protein product [Cylicocyclus nassatus]|uniref:Serpentine receptor class gamma n=1 Tax=Cylicocyclus nassatus TaxID=53992 RepID=A0AA36GG58_CYLNA|nr:unnamed protein product [Cylicocyclus nassatus]